LNLLFIFFIDASHRGEPYFNHGLGIIKMGMLNNLNCLENVSLIFIIELVCQQGHTTVSNYK